MIEKIYCDEINLIAKRTTRLCENKLKHSVVLDLDILNSEKESPKERMKKFFKQYNSIYRESIFAEKFFAQLDYENSENKVVKRLYKIISEIFQSKPDL